jgi:hypothetical protein
LKETYVAWKLSSREEVLSLADGSLRAKKININFPLMERLTRSWQATWLRTQEFQDGLSWHA